MFTEFKEITKNEWLQKIEKEYRDQKTIDDLYFRIGNILEIHPFHHDADKTPSFTINPFPTSIKFGIQVPEKYDHQRQLIQLLYRGIQLIFYNNNAHWDDKEAQKIHWDYLFTIAPQDSQAANFIHNYLSKTEKSIGNHLLISNSQNIISIDLGSIYSGKTKLKTELKKIQQIPQNTSLIIVLSDYFLFNIGLMRGIQYYLLQKFSRKNRPMVIAQCLNVYGAQEEVLVSETVQTTSAILSGVENVLFSSHPKAWIQEYQSMIPHLLREESKLTFSEDPISGSAYLDYISWQIFSILNTHQ